MPENWLGYGITASQEATVQMCDAQGQSMPYHGSRLLTLDLGEACVQEKFHASSVSAPLLSLGRLLKKEWMLTRENDVLRRIEDIHVPVSFKKNSLGIEAPVHAVSEVAPENSTNVSMSEKAPEAVRPLTEERRIFVDLAFRPEELASSEEGQQDDLGRRWQFRQNGDPVCMTTGTTFVDPNSIMDPKLRRCRTTLVKIANGWELVDFQQQLQNADVLDKSVPGLLYPSMIVTILERKPKTFEFLRIHSLQLLR